MALNSLQSLPFHCLGDNEFMHIIFEQQHGPIHFDSDRLASLKFNPLIMDLHNYRRLTLTNDLDPDSNSCNYFVEDEFNEMMKTIKIKINKNRYFISISGALTLIWRN